MVSSPSFDPNELASHDLSAVEKAAKRLNERKDRPLENRAIRRDLPPGSVFKLVTAAAALETGDYDADSMVTGGPTYKLPGTRTSIAQGGRSSGTTQARPTHALAPSLNTPRAKSVGTG